MSICKFVHYLAVRQRVRIDRGGARTELWISVRTLCRRDAALRFEPKHARRDSPLLHRLHDADLARVLAELGVSKDLGEVTCESCLRTLAKDAVERIQGMERIA